MASARKKALLSAYYIFGLTAITMGARDSALIRLALEGNENYTNEYTFPGTMFQDFHSCLCNGDAAKCLAYHKPLGLGFYSVYNVYREVNVSSISNSLTYKCTKVASFDILSCERQPLQGLPTFSTGEINSQSFIIPHSACGSKCVVLLWQFNVEEIIFDVSVDAENCGTNCECPSTTTTTTTTGTSQAVFSNPTVISTEPKTASTSVATDIITRAPTPSNVISTDTTNAANPGSKTTQEDTPIGLIIGVVLGVIIVITVIVIGIIIWRRRRAAPGLDEQMFHQIETPKESNEARTQGPKSKNNMDGTSDTQSPSTNKSDLERVTYAMPHKTKHQQDFIPTGIAKNGTTCALSFLNQLSVNEKDAPDGEYPRVKVGNVRNNDRSSGGGDYNSSNIDQEF